ncbi:MAG TPA: 50S ribosomal protein L18 [Chitinophagaceae bacterium]|nr:50S ribosomal protein L18 [Chitinophagaceae bacterium]
MDKKSIRRRKIHYRIRNKVSGTAGKPRLSVFRSNRDIYAQLIDDENGQTIVAASSRDKAFKVIAGNKVETSRQVGQELAKKAVALGVTKCVFDRSGYLYHGRVKSLSEGAREGGLQF